MRIVPQRRILLIVTLYLSLLVFVVMASYLGYSSSYATASFAFFKVSSDLDYNKLGDHWRDRAVYYTQTRSRFPAGRRVSYTIKKSSSTSTNETLRSNESKEKGMLGLPVPLSATTFSGPKAGAHEGGEGQQQQIRTLSALVLFCVGFSWDILNFTRVEIEQWMAYMTYAGVQHFYMYDNCQTGSDECQDWLALDERVTYQRWAKEMSGAVQIKAYTHHFQSRKMADESEFEIMLDIDEYVFMPHDTEQGFLSRYACQMKAPQTLLRTMFFGGEKESNHSWRVMRYLHRQNETVPTGRTKPLYRTAMVDPHQARIHDVGMRKSTNDSVTKVTADPSVIRLNHYWCDCAMPCLYYT